MRRIILGTLALAGLLLSLVLFSFSLPTVENHSLSPHPSWFIGQFFLVVFFLLLTLGSFLRREGAPVENISEGNYAIVASRITDKNVQLLIKRSSSLDPVAQTLFYEFPKRAFNGEIVSDAETLVVTVSGGSRQFKKLHLTRKPVDELLPAAKTVQA